MMRDWTCVMVVWLMGCAGPVPDSSLAVSQPSLITALATPLTPPPELAQLQFGRQIATDGESVLVAAYDFSATQGGGVALYTRESDAWIERRVFTSVDENTSFGSAIAVDGDTIAIGTGGEVEVHRNSGGSWQPEALLDGQFLHVAFGDALALDGHRLAVGDREAIYPDSAYVFQRSVSSWSEMAHLTSLVADDVEFGLAVALSGDVLVVGAPQRLPVKSPGAAHVFRRQGADWVPSHTLASGSTNADQFGAALALSGTMLVVGARTYQEGSGPTGAIWLYEDGGGAFQEVEVLTSKLGLVGFGGVLAFDGVTLLAGAGGIGDSGRVETFVRDASGWIPGPLLAQAALPEGADFGASVDVAGDVAVVGAPGSNTAYAYRLVAGKECSADGASVIETDGTSTSCTPYVCSEGACRTGCAVSSDCALGNVCDTSLGAGQCIEASQASAVQGDTGGCGLTLRQRPSWPVPPLALVVVSVLIARRPKHAR